MLSLRLWLGGKIYGSAGISAKRISPNRMVKWNCEEPELEAQRYIAANTTIPIPRIQGVHKRKGKLALEMDFIPDCDILQACWHDFTDEQKQALVEEIGGYIKQLRDLEPPSAHRISSTDGNACRQIRVGSVKRFGPFDDASGLHTLIRGGWDLERSTTLFGEEVVRVHERDYKIRFTHGDLGVQNILVRKDATVAAIIDWECAGWYPEYWEYTMAHYNAVLLPEFYDMLREKVDRYDEELAAERILWQKLDQPLDEKLK
jgi:hypothetical protein